MKKAWVQRHIVEHEVVSMGAENDSFYTDSEVHETLAKRIRAGWTVESVVFRFARRVEDTRRRKRRVRR